MIVKLIIPTRKEIDLFYFYSFEFIDFEVDT